MRANLKRHVDQITQNVITLLNTSKFKLGLKSSVRGNRKIVSRCHIASCVSGPLDVHILSLVHAMKKSNSSLQQL